MTTDHPTCAEHLGQPKRMAPGCLTLCVTAFLVIIGLYWLISGEINIAYKAVSITGMPARIVAVLWIIVVIGLSRAGRSRPTTP